MFPLLLTAVVAGGALQRITGMGFALAAGPFVVLMLGVEQGVLLINILGATSSLANLIRVRKHVDWKLFGMLVIPAVLAGPLTVVALAGAPTRTLEVILGAAVVVGMTGALLAGNLGSGDRIWRKGARGPAVAAGLLSGVGSGAAGIGGPPMAIYAVLDRTDQRVFAATLQPFFMVNASFAAGARVLLAEVSYPDLAPWQWGAVVACVVVAGLLGDLIARWLPRTALRKVLVVVAYLGGTATLLRGLGILPS